MAISIIVVGSTGFLGANLLQSLLEAGLHPMAGIRSGSDTWRLDAAAPNVERVVCDISSSDDSLAAIFKKSGVDIVINCAAYGVDYRQSDFEVATFTNIIGARRLVFIAAAAGCKRYIHMGTSFEYGIHSKSISETALPSPIGIYGVTKAAGTLAVLDAARVTGLPTVVIRAFGMYGPLEGVHKFVPLIMDAGMTGRTLELTSGEQIRDYVYVGDVARGLTHLCQIDKFPSGEIFNFCCGEMISLRQLGEVAMDAIGGNQNNLLWGARSYRSDEVMVTVGDSTKAARELGWVPTTSLSEGMKLTASALRSILHKL